MGTERDVRGLLPISSAIAACGLAIASPPARADELTIGAGSAVGPRYPGADQYVVFPFAGFSYSTDSISVRTNGIGLEADLVPSQSLDAGPIVRVNLGRQGTIRDPVVRLLPRVGTGVEVGGFVGTGFPLGSSKGAGPSIATAQISVVQDIAGGHRGLRVEASAGIVAPVTRGSSLIIQGAAGFGSTKYNRAFFGVTMGSSAVSGLPAYAPRGGMTDIGSSSVLEVQVSRRWSISGFANYSRLVGDAARSPIVSQRGSRNQFFGGLLLNYRFGSR